MDFNNKTHDRSPSGSSCARCASSALENFERCFTQFAWYYYAKFVSVCVKGAR